MNKGHHVPKAWEARDYEGQFMRVGFNHSHSPTGQKIGLMFKVPEMDQCLTYYVGDFNTPDQGLSLKRACYYLLGEATVPLDACLRPLIRRYVILVIEPQLRNGRLIPVIVNFRFSPRQLFSWSGEPCHDR